MPAASAQVLTASAVMASMRSAKRVMTASASASVDSAKSHLRGQAMYKHQITIEINAPRAR